MFLQVLIVFHLETVESTPNLKVFHRLYNPFVSPLMALIITIIKEKLNQFKVPLIHELIHYTIPKIIKYHKL